MTMTSFSPDIVAFCCAHSAYRAADGAGQMRIPYPQNIMIVRLPCMGRLDELHILKAFENGADGVLVLTCPEDSCHHVSGSTRAKQRVRAASILLSEVGIDDGRVQMHAIGPNMAPKFAQIANEATDRLRKLGPGPVKKKAA